MKRILFIFTLLMLILCFSIGASCAELDDYMITDEAVISNFPEYENPDFPTTFKFYNIVDGTYHVATSASCCGFRHDGFIDSSNNTFKVGDSSFRFYFWNGSKWRNVTSASVDLSIYKLIGYDDAVSNLYIDNNLVETNPEITIKDYSYTPPYRTEYFYGYERFDTSGFKVVANYTDGTSVDVTDTCTISKPDVISAGVYSFMAVCNNGDYSVTDTIEFVRVVDVQFTPPTRKNYTMEDSKSIDISGMKLIVVYDDGRSFDFVRELVPRYPDKKVFGVNTIYVKFSRLDYETSFDIYIADGITDEEDISNATLGQQILNGIEEVFNSLFGVLISLGEFLYNLVIKLGDFVVSLKDFVVKLPDFINAILAMFYNSENGEPGVLLNILNNFFTHNTYSNGILAIFLAMLFFGLYNGIKSFVTWLVQWL